MSGVLPLDRIPGIAPKARQTLTVRDVLTVRPTVVPVVDPVNPSLLENDEGSEPGEEMSKAFVVELRKLAEQTESLATA